MEVNKVIQTDALEGFKQLSDESIDCIVTSPPYWALRDYGDGTEKIWDGAPDCEHEFYEVETKRENMSGGKGHVQDGNKGSFAVDYNDRKTKSKFCQKCGAWKGQLGLEPNFDLYIKHLCDIFEEGKRCLKEGGTCWVNLGDTYYTKSGSNFKQSKQMDNQDYVNETGLKKANNLRDNGEIPSKCLTLIPFRFAIEMVNRGWILRNTIIWHKPSCMPSSVKDRFTVDFEYVFFFVKNKKYWFEQQFESLSEATEQRAKYNWCKEDNKSTNYQDLNELNRNESYADHINFDKGRNKRTTWDINPGQFPEAHFAVFPEELIKTPIKAGCPREGIVCDPFMGSGTTGVVAKKLNRNWIGFEINSEYVKLAEKRIENQKRFLRRVKAKRKAKKRKKNHLSLDKFKEK